MSNHRSALVPLLALFLMTLMIGHVGRAQDDSDKPATKPPAKKKLPKLEDVTARSVAWARTEGHERRGFSRVTTIPSEAMEYTTLVIMVEFGDGSIGMYQGAADAAEDKYVICVKEDLALLEEVIARAKRRQNTTAGGRTGVQFTMAKCMHCNDEAGFDSPDDLCHRHQAEWWVDGLEPRTAAERQKLIDERLSVPLGPAPTVEEQRQAIADVKRFLGEAP